MSSREEKTENLKKGLLDISNYNIPTICKECGGILIFKGVGEYKCEDCGHLEYDDYGTVRNYIEKHPGITSAQVSEATGVTQKSIREMLKEERLEIAPTSNAFLTCEICGKQIRSGRYCSRCEAAYHKEIEEKARASRNINISGFGAEKHVGEEGSKRFTRDR
ncbi:MAG: hypothetical protein K2L82_09330 [Lachnospiraceae bacterium]|nr:hypothetical protein [Lachnospiraceae bacterium]